MSLQLSHRISGYLKLRRTQAILGCFLGISLLLVALPAIDLGISRLFYDDGFYMADSGWTKFFHNSVSWFVYGALLVVGGAYAFNKIFRRYACGIDGRKAIYLVLVLGLGSGLIVNGVFKEGFGRARPKNVEAFGGMAKFTPAYYISSNCAHNCSFSSGDTSAAFFALAFIPIARRRRAVAAAAVAYGVVVSGARIASGSHFFSDTVVSFFVMLTIADALHYFMFRFDGKAVEPARASALNRATMIRAPEKPTSP